jgi:hypothetical protein
MCTEREEQKPGADEAAAERAAWKRRVDEALARQQEHRKEFFAALERLKKITGA